MLIDQEMVTKGGTSRFPTFNIQKDYDKWVKIKYRSHHIKQKGALVPKGGCDSAKGGMSLVPKGAPTKDILQKTTTKDIAPSPTDAGLNETNQVIDLFRNHLNPNIKFGNTTQRKSAEELLRKHGIEKLKRLILFCEKITGEDFAPIVTTPYQLVEKEAQVAAYWVRQNKKGPNVAFIS